MNGLRVLKYIMYLPWSHSWGGGEWSLHGRSDYEHGIPQLKFHAASASPHNCVPVKIVPTISNDCCL
jgi:hypothetical protein